MQPPWTKEFSCEVRRILDDAFDDQEEAATTRLAAALDLSYPTLAAYLNTTRTFPPDLIPRLARALAEMKGIEWGTRVIQAAAGTRWEVIPAPQWAGMTEKLADLPRFAKEVSESIAKVSSVLEDDNIAPKEAFDSRREISEARLCLWAIDQELKRRAGQ